MYLSSFSVQNVREYYGSEVIIKATKQHLKANGNKSAEFVLEEISANPDLANDVKEFIEKLKKTGEKEPKSLEPLDCLGLVFKENMSIANWTVSKFLCHIIHISRLQIILRSSKLLNCPLKT